MITISVESNTSNDNNEESEEFNFIQVLPSIDFSEFNVQGSPQLYEGE